MAAATKSREGTKVHGKVLDQRSMPVAAATVIYAYTMVSMNANGYLVPAADVAGQANRKVWIALEEVDNTTGTDGAFSCLVMIRGTGVIDHALTQAATWGLVVDVGDDQTAVAGGASINNRPIGVVTGWQTGILEVQIG